MTDSVIPEDLPEPVNEVLGQLDQYFLSEGIEIDPDDVTEASRVLLSGYRKAEAEGQASEFLEAGYQLLEDVTATVVGVPRENYEPKHERHSLGQYEPPLLATPPGAFGDAFRSICPGFWPFC